MNNVRKPLTGLIALGVALAMPMAFAQEADEFTQQPAPTEQAAPAAPQGQVSWADLDTDGDGNLSRAEAASLPELAAIFDQADADGEQDELAEEGEGGEPEGHDQVQHDQRRDGPGRRCPAMHHLRDG